VNNKDIGMVDTINVDKIKVIISYLADKVDKLYVTKLMKLFYYIDFISYAERKSSITNDVYYKLPYGPIPSFIKSEIDNLIGSFSEEDIKSQLFDIIELKENENRYGKIVVSKNKRYNLKELSEYEIGLIDEIINKLGDKTARFLTNKTHKEQPYLLTSKNSIISYGLAEKLGDRKVLNS